MLTEHKRNTVLRKERRHREAEENNVEIGKKIERKIKQGEKMV